MHAVVTLDHRQRLKNLPPDGVAPAPGRAASAPDGCAPHSLGPSPPALRARANAEAPASGAGCGRRGRGATLARTGRHISASGLPRVTRWWRLRGSRPGTMIWRRLHPTSSARSACPRRARASAGAPPPRAHAAARRGAPRWRAGAHEQMVQPREVYDAVSREGEVLPLSRGLSEGSRARQGGDASGGCGRRERWQKVPGGVRRERSAPRPPSRGRREEEATLSRCEAQLQAHAPFPDRAPIQCRGAGDDGKTLRSTGAEARAAYGQRLEPECGCRRGRRDSQLLRASLAPRSTRAPDRSSVPERRCLLSNHLHPDCCASLHLCCTRGFSTVRRLERSGALHMCDLLDLLHDL